MKILCLCECCDEVLVEMEAAEGLAGNGLTPKGGGDIIKYTSLCDDCRELFYGDSATSSFFVAHRLH